MRPSLARRRNQAGMTLIELLIAVTLFGAISASMGVVLNIAFTSMNKIDTKVDSNRRIIASERTLDQILQGLIPVVTPCAGRPVGISGTESGLRFLSSHSLTEGSRGRPQIVELFADRSPNGGFRLLLNEFPYLGKRSLSAACTQPFRVLDTSFILADRLSRCRFAYRRIDEGSGAEAWFPVWVFPDWPSGIRIEMMPAKIQANQIQPTTVFAPILVKNTNVDETNF
jgi:prepilin-type N-terminal cleavage/methylation domain-containing protein